MLEALFNSNGDLSCAKQLLLRHAERMRAGRSVPYMTREETHMDFWGIFELCLSLFLSFLDFWSNLKVCGSKTVFFELLQAKPCRIILKFRLKVYLSPKCAISF